MPDQLPEPVVSLLRGEHQIDPGTVRTLSTAHAERLREVAAGVSHPEYRIKALALVAATEDTDDTGELFLSALRDDAAALTVRAAGATWLSRSASPVAEAALLGALRTESAPPVQHKIIAGLARVGTAESMAALSEITDPLIAPHAAFARSVVAYRAGLSGYELPVIADTDLLPAATPAIEASDTVELDSAALAGDVYGVTLEGSASLVRCDGRTLAIAVDRTVRPAVLDTPAVAGLVALRAESDGSLHTAMLIFCWPAEKDSVHVSVQRTTGSPAYFGRGDLDGQSIRFHLDAVRTPGATHTTITGTLTDGTLADLRISVGDSLPKQTPQRL